MSIIDYRSPKQILVPVKGHPYERDAFFDVFESLQGIAYTAVEQPASQAFFERSLAADYDAFVLYDMPGLDFSKQPPDIVSPSETFKQNFLDLLEAGHGFVFLHHSLAAWPDWPEYAEIVGGRFFYLPGKLRGEQRLDSGYRHKVSYRASVEQQHPVASGLPQQFDVCDELYLCEVFEDDVIPLLRSDYSFDREHFYSAHNAVTGRMNSNADWPHPEGSSLVGWVKSYRNSPIVYLQLGDGPDVYANANFRRLLGNAIDWVSSEEAKAWAKSRNSR